MTRVLPPRVTAGASRTPRHVQLGVLLRTHWVLAVLLAAGAALRVLVVLAYQPAILYIDSFSYLDNLDELAPDGLRPIGYVLILDPLLFVADLRFVTIAQHLLGLGIAVAVYALVLRYGARRWLAAVASAPLLLGAYQVQIEHNIMSDVWFQALLVGLMWLLIGRGEPSARRAGLAGLLIGVSAVVRLVGVTLWVPVLAYLIVVGSHWGSRAGWRRIGRRAGAMTLGFAVVLVSYAGYYRVATGGWGLTGAGGGIYGRAATIADCSQFPVGSPERAVCPDLPRRQRFGVDYYAHDTDAPPHTAQLPPGVSPVQAQADFTWQVFVNQPLDLATAIGLDFLKGFRPLRVDAANDVPVDRWHFKTSYPYFWDPPKVRAVALEHGDVPIEVNQQLASFLRTYQLTVGYTPGPLLALAGLAGLAGGLGVGAARRSGIRAASLLVSGLGVTVLLTAAAFEFSWRYQLPGLVLLPVAGALGLTAFTGPLRRPDPRLGLRAPLSPYPDAVDRAAATRFIATEGQPRWAPVVVIIAAYNEEGAIGAVLDAVPSSSGGLPVDTLVVVDGGTDRTADVARQHGARVCQVDINRGQGAALRLGYALARAGGARYIVTTDADGQYDLDELPLLLAPLVAGEADFVTGSRRLGREQTTDPVRRLGVRAFAALARALTGQRVSDTSFGFRAMRAEVTGSVPLHQAQYQSSELLIGLLSRGYRVVEMPMTMLIRSTGKSKKGNNLAYGGRYARVMVATWWRDRSCRRAATVKTSWSSNTNLTTKSRP